MRTPALLLFLLLAFSGCKKNQDPPTIELKSGSGYTSADITASPGSTIVVGVNAYKTSDDLSLFYTEVAYDGANAPTLVSRVYASENEKEHFTRDVTITLRNTIGIERWIFDINDSEGRISKKEIRIYVQ